MTFDILPLCLLFLVTIALALAAVEVGYLIGKYRRRAPDAEKEAIVAPIVAATLGLLAFMLAFTFGMAAARFDARRHMVVDDANTIGTAHLRAGLLPEPHRSEIRALLRKYVDVRLEGVQSGNVEPAMIESVALQDQLWPHAEALAKEDSHSIAAGLFIESLNDMIDMHAKRVLVGVRNRIPIVVWGALYFIACLCMAEIGYNIGLAGSGRTWAVPALILTFAVVMLLIEDLDRPREGLLQVSQEALLDLKKSFAAPADR